MDYLFDRDWNQPVRYPDPAVEVIDPRFRQYVLGSATLERLWSGGRWTEGPRCLGEVMLEVANGPGMCIGTIGLSPTFHVGNVPRMAANRCWP